MRKLAALLALTTICACGSETARPSPASDEADLATLGLFGKKMKDQPVPTADEAAKDFGLTEVPYITDDSFINSPNGLLGQVVVIRKSANKCPGKGDVSHAEFSVNPMVAYSEAKKKGFKVDPASVLTQPQKMKSRVINADVATKVGFLNMFSSQLDAKTVLSLIVFNQAGARVDDHDASWKEAVDAWQVANKTVMDDADVCWVWAVKGFIQKNVVSRKFVSVKAGGGGGAYGVQIDGSAYTSSDDYEVDVRFGLSSGVMKRPAGPGPEGLVAEGDEPTEADLAVFVGVTSIAHPGSPQ